MTKFVPPPWLDSAQALLAGGLSASDCARELGLSKDCVLGHVARGHLVLPVATRERNLDAAARRKATMASGRGTPAATRSTPPAPAADLRTEKQRLRDKFAEAWRNTAAMARGD